MKEKTELEKAKDLLAKAEKEKTDLFQKEYEELCRKHGYIIDVQTMMVIKKTA